MNEHIRDQHRPGVSPWRRLRMNCRKSHDQPVHHQVNAEAVEQTADDRVIDHEGNAATGEVIDGGDDQRDQEMKKETEDRSFGATCEGALTEGATCNGLENSAGRNLVTKAEEDARVGD